LTAALFAQPKSKPTDTDGSASLRQDNTNPVAMRPSTGAAKSVNNKGGIDLEKSQMDIKQQSSLEYSPLTPQPSTPYAITQLHIDPATFTGFTFKILSLTRNQALGKVLES
jgi:hypothetical protein